MYTQCPQCLTIYEIDEDALQASLGIVRCGKCSERFDAMKALSDSLPADPADTLFGDDEPRELTLTTPVPSADTPPGAGQSQGQPGTQPAGEAPPALGDDTEDWVANLNTDLTAALIADAAGIPREALPDDDDWRLAEDAPAQARIPGLDDAAPDADAADDQQPSPAPTDTTPDADATGDRPAAPGGDDPESGALPEVTAVDLPEGEPWALLEPTPGPAPDPGPAETPDAEPQETPEPAREESPASTSDETPDDTPDLLPETGLDELSEPAPDEASETATGDLPGLGPVEPPEGTREETPEDLPADADSATPEPTPVYVRPRRRGIAQPGLWWALGCLFLVVVLAAQLAWIKRAELVRNPQTRPWMQQVCTHISCNLPLIRDIGALELVSRDIRPDPTRPGALVITATIRNDASFSQPWPIVTVELGNLDGNPVAMRRFRPSEYMPDPARRAAGIEAGDTAAVAFEVADPGRNAVNFQFGFQ